jgi:hypothetical protein
MQLSKEVSLLVQMVRQELLQVETTFDSSGIDWTKFRKTCAYHGMRHIAFSAHGKQKVLPDELAAQYKHFTLNRSKIHFEQIVEIKRLYDLFTRAGLQPILLKGLLFTHLLYKNKLLRESADIDFLFSKSQALDGIQILLSEGYKCLDLGILGQTKDLHADIEKLIFESGFQELQLDKNKFSADFHWGLSNQFLNYQVDHTLFFKNLEMITFHGKEIYIANSNAMFWSLVLHHGGKELWLKLKCLVDLLAFMEQYKGIVDWKLILRQSEEYKLSTLLKTGFWYLAHVFHYDLPEILKAEIQGFRPKKINHVVDFWERSAYWNKAIPRINYEFILHFSQDKGYTIWGYIQKMYRTYSLPNPFERKRIFNFPANWTFLNFIDKLISYLLTEKK